MWGIHTGRIHRYGLVNRYSIAPQRRWIVDACSSNINYDHSYRIKPIIGRLLHRRFGSSSVYGSSITTRTTDLASFESYTFVRRSRFSTEWPRLESATGRARKRRRRIRLRKEREQAILAEDGEDEQQQPQSNYPPGRPWAVLYPNPYQNPPDRQEEKKRRRNWKEFYSDFVRACELYASTWDYDFLKKKSDDKDEENDKDKEVESRLSAAHVRSNVDRNLELVRKDGKELLEQAKETTGIRNQEELKNFVSRQMELASECLKEFMAGYREGRDQEIDNMLNEYFQDDGDERDNVNGKDQAGKRRRRKKKRRVITD